MKKTQIVILVSVFLLLATVIVGNGLVLGIATESCTHYSGGLGVRLGKERKLNWFLVWQLGLRHERISLDLSDSKVTDDEILRLANVTMLRSLIVDDTAVTEEGVKALRSINPRIVVMEYYQK